MTARNELIRSLRRAITELKIRRQDPATSPAERAQLTAEIAELEAQLAELSAQRIADAAAGVALAPPDADTFAQMRAAARALDDAIANQRTSAAIVGLVNSGIAVLRA
jgi:hypothetical protein